MMGGVEMSPAVSRKPAGADEVNDWLLTLTLGAGARCEGGVMRPGRPGERGLGPCSDLT